MEQLLKILEDNARLPIEDIATMLNKSPAEVAAMIDLARAQGIIKGYKTLVDWEKAGVNRVEAVIELNVSPKKSRGFDEIAATIAAFDEVESVLLMSGGYDLQLVIKGQTFQDIATMLNKSPAEVAAMIDLARAQGIIKGYKTLVDWEKAGVNRVEAVIELNVSPKKSRGFDEIAATIAAFDEVESVLLMSGGYDLQLVIKGQTFQEIALFVAKRLSPLDDVLSTATHFVLRTYKKEGRLYQDEEIDERECTVL